MERPIIQATLSLQEDYLSASFRCQVQALVPASDPEPPTIEVAALQTLIMAQMLIENIGDCRELGLLSSRCVAVSDQLEAVVAEYIDHVDRIERNS